MLTIIYIIIFNLGLFCLYNAIVYRKDLVIWLKSLDRGLLELSWFLVTMLSSCLGVILVMVYLTQTYGGH